MAAADARFLRAVANHIILPPDLPGGVDKNLFQINNDLLQRAQDACSSLKAAVKDEFQKELGLLRSSLDHCRYIHTSAHLDSLQLQRAFRRLQEGETLIVHVNEQNAGLLIRRGAGYDFKSSPFLLIMTDLASSHLENQVIFEALEVSAQSEQVLGAADALQWSFPTAAAAIPNNVFADENFQQYLADFLERGSMENIKKFGAVTRKANSSAFEPRDTADPALITSLLITILEGIGRLIPVLPTLKRVRDEVRWQESEIPWRRSPFWLLLRVGMVRHLEASTTPTVANTLYKALFCVLQAGLLGQLVGSQSPDLSHLLLRKLCRRVAKLEKDRILAVSTSSDASKPYDIVLPRMRPLLFQATQAASTGLRNTWNGYRAKTQRRISKIMCCRAGPALLKLGLKNSGPYLNMLRRHPLLHNPSASTYVMTPTMLQFLQKYSDLAQTEDQSLAQDGAVDSINEKNWTKLILTLAEEVQSYLSKADDECYEIGTVDRSRMILTVIWLWLLMDRLLCQFVPGFFLHKPVFHPHILDCMTLSSYAGLCRLHQIQSYLAMRHTPLGGNGVLTTIFHPPAKGCFGDRYFQSLESDSEPRRLGRAIEKADERSKQEKETEWSDKDAEHQRLMRDIAATTCQYTFTGDLLNPEHNEYTCDKCILTKKAGRIRIERVEKAMPYGIAQAHSVLFELCCPKSYAAYRNATWAVVATLGLPSVQKTKEALELVDHYYQEVSKQRGRRTTMAGVTLGSRDKSFIQTHYDKVYFPVPFENVCVNNGLRFEYYDLTRKLWPAEHLDQITFGHHCWLTIPRRTPFARIEFPDRVQPDQNPSTSSPGVTAMKYLGENAEITSNEILAGLPRCPQILGVPEFMAFQTILCGSQRLWPTILVELGSSNLNFSSEAVMILTQALSNRTGQPSEGTFHTSNIVFRDDCFCSSLLSQIERRLVSISSNWRESNCMEVLLTFVLKVLSLGSTAVCLKAMLLLEDIRNITNKWIKTIRQDLWRTVNTFALARLTQCVVWAALLCRRTFTMYSTEGPEGLRSFSISATDGGAHPPDAYTDYRRLPSSWKHPLRYRKILRKIQEHFLPCFALQWSVISRWPRGCKAG